MILIFYCLKCKEEKAGDRVSIPGGMLCVPCWKRDAMADFKKNLKEVFFDKPLKDHGHHSALGA